MLGRAAVRDPPSAGPYSQWAGTLGCEPPWIWIKTNSLKLNDSKTEEIVFGSAQQLKKITLQSLRVGDCVVRVTNCVRILGVQFDAEMTMESHVTAACRSAIFHLRNISRISRYLTPAATEQVVHAFVTSRLDIGNALLYRLPLKQMQRLQKIQNWAARLIDGSMRYSHATPLLKKLHGLPIAVRVEFKIQLLTHRALNGQAPEYTADASRLGRCAPANS